MLHQSNRRKTFLLPKEDDTVLIYRYNENGDDIELALIEDDNEFEKVSEAFNELWDEDDEEEE